MIRNGALAASGAALTLRPTGGDLAGICRRWPELTGPAAYAVHAIAQVAMIGHVTCL
jgi:hypothetical protein